MQNGCICCTLMSWRSNPRARPHSHREQRPGRFGETGTSWATGVEFVSFLEELLATS